jgi:hypothetical protein
MNHRHNGEDQSQAYPALLTDPAIACTVIHNFNITVPLLLGVLAVLGTSS